MRLTRAGGTGGRETRGEKGLQLGLARLVDWRPGSWAGQTLASGEGREWQRVAASGEGPEGAPVRLCPPPVAVAHSSKKPPTAASQQEEQAAAVDRLSHTRTPNSSLSLTYPLTHYLALSHPLLLPFSIPSRDKRIQVLRAQDRRDPLRSW